MVFSSISTVSPTTMHDKMELSGVRIKREPSQTQGSCVVHSWPRSFDSPVVRLLLPQPKPTATWGSLLTM